MDLTVDKLKETSSTMNHMQSRFMIFFLVTRFYKILVKVYTICNIQSTLHLDTLNTYDSGYTRVETYHHIKFFPQSLCVDFQ